MEGKEEDRSRTAAHGQQLKRMDSIELSVFIVPVPGPVLSWRQVELAVPSGRRILNDR